MSDFMQNTYYDCPKCGGNISARVVLKLGGADTRAGYEVRCPEGCIDVREPLDSVTQYASLLTAKLEELDALPPAEVDHGN